MESKHVVNSPQQPPFVIKRIGGDDSVKSGGICKFYIEPSTDIVNGSVSWIIKDKSGSQIPIEQSWANGNNLDFNTAAVALGTYTIDATLKWKHSPDSIGLDNLQLEVVNKYEPYKLEGGEATIDWCDSRTFEITPKEGAQQIKWSITKDGNPVPWDAPAGDLSYLNTFEFCKDGVGEYVVTAVVKSKIAGEKDVTLESKHVVNYEELIATVIFDDATLRGSKEETFHGVAILSGSIKSGTITFTRDGVVPIPYPLVNLKPGTHDKFSHPIEFTSGMVGDINIQLAVVLANGKVDTSTQVNSLHHKIPRNWPLAILLALGTFIMFILALRRYSDCDSRKWRWYIAASADRLSKNPKNSGGSRKSVNPKNWASKYLEKYAWVYMKDLSKQADKLEGEYDWLNSGGKVKIAATVEAFKLVNEDQGEFEIKPVVSILRPFQDRIYRLSKKHPPNSEEILSDLFIKVRIIPNAITFEKIMIGLAMLIWIVATVFAYVWWIQ